ncbi:MAG TPA: hypothetical protein VFE84_13920 [Patescibacteria group bacterium]|jgi:hypothetical protein|nr:hypothetical protein [Patescibacteria group bacterium]
MNILPILMLVLVAVSFFQLVAELVSGETAGRRMIVQWAWFLGAVWLQFFGRSPALTVAGLLLQVFLAIYLRVRATLLAGS